MTLRSLIFAASLAVALGASAQAVVKMPVAQNPPFGIVVEQLNLTLPEGGLTLGANAVISGGSGKYSYAWYDSANTLLGTDATLNVTAPGNYRLDVKDSCDCLLTVDFTVGGAGVDAVALPSLSVWPNPTSGIVNIDGCNAASVALLDTGGKLSAVFVPAAAEALRSIDISSRPAGCYILCITDVDGATAATRIIKL